MLDGLLELRSQIRLGGQNCGIDINGKVANLEMFGNVGYRTHALEAACETACGLLRVDQVISAVAIKSISLCSYGSKQTRIGSHK